jgi:hypothetical protein
MIAAVSGNAPASTPHPVPPHSERSPPPKSDLARDTVHLSAEARAASDADRAGDRH